MEISCLGRRRLYGDYVTGENQLQSGALPRSSTNTEEQRKINAKEEKGMFPTASINQDGRRVKHED